MSTFVTLPNELLLEIARCVDQRADLHALTLVSKQCYGVVDSVLWQREVSLNRPGPLHWAIEEGNISLVRKALDHGADPNQTAYSRLPRSKAIKTRWWDYTPHLGSTQSLTSNGHSRDHDSVDSSWAEFGRVCWRPLHLAVTKGRTNMVEMLLDYGAKIDELSWRLCECIPHPSHELFPTLTAVADGRGLGFLDIKDGGWTPLHVAICHKDVEMAKLLLRRGASTDIHQDLRWHNAFGEPAPGRNITAMHEAAIHGLLDLMVFLVEGGYQSVDADSRLLGKPIHLAIWNGHFDTVVPWLKEQGANLDEVCRESGTTPLLLMCKKHQLDSVVQLIELGADVSPRAVDHPSRTALHLLAYPPPDNLKNLCNKQKRTKSEVVKLLVSNGLDVDTPEADSGNSALIVASGHCDLDMMRTLLDCGADPNYRDSGGSTAFNKVGVLTDSPKPRIYEAGRMLSDWGLDIQGPFEENQTTPLNSVCLARARSVTNAFREKQFLKLARLLLNRGADPNETGRFSSGPVSQAIFSCAFDMASLLLEKGGRPQVNDLEALLKPMVLRPSYEPGLVSYVLGLDYQRYGILRPTNMFLDELVKKSFIQGAWKATAELVEHHRSSALPPNALHRLLDRSTRELSMASNYPVPLVRALLKDGADPNVTWKSEPALYYAGRCSALEECVGELIAAGADLDKPTPKMPQGALLYLFKNGRHSALGQIIEHDDKILHNRPKEFHSKCWEYLLRPGVNKEMIGDSLYFVAGGEQEATWANAENTTGEIDLDEEYYDLTPISWQPICEYIKHGLRTDVDLERGGTLRSTIQKVVSRCPRPDYEARSQVIEHLGLSEKGLGLLNELSEYEKWKKQASLENELRFP